MDYGWLASIAPEEALRGVLFFVVYLLTGFLPLCGVLYVIYFLLTIPLRRKERGRLFVDLLDSGLRRGQGPEATVQGVASTRDLSLGVRFYLVAEQVAKGERLSQALGRVPRFVPPQIASVLQVGERIGNLRAVLPVCRHLLEDGVSQVRGALNYLVLLVFALTPALVVVPAIFQVFVLPKYREVFSAMTGGQLPGFTRFVFSEQRGFLYLELAILIFLWLVGLAYLGGPRVAGVVNRILPGSVDRLALLLPWRRHRLQRDFSSLLALLLDAGVPEREAVRLAAEGVHNRIFLRRSARVQEALAQGRTLPEALGAIDDSGEFRWRMQNAKHGQAGFARALAGWHDALNAKAFQLEQAAAQLVTTLLVLLNGLIVGSLVIAIFLALIAITNEAALW